MHLPIEKTIEHLLYPEQLTLLTKLSPEEKRKIWDEMTEEKKQEVNQLVALKGSRKEDYINGYLPLWGTEFTLDPLKLLAFNPQSNDYSIITIT